MNNHDVESIRKLLKQVQKYEPNITQLPTAIYARKSTIDTSGVSLDTQVGVCDGVINAIPELKLVETYREENKSGYTLKGRKQMLKLIETVKQRKG